MWITDGNNNTTTLHHDPIDRVTEIDYAGATSCNGGHTNCDSYTYDGAGNLTSYQDGADTTVTYGYDAANNLTKIVDAAGTTPPTAPSPTPHHQPLRLHRRRPQKQHRPH